MGGYLALRVEGPLASVATGLWGELVERGYSPNRVRTRIRLVLELSRWMDRRGVGLEELDADMLETLVTGARAGSTQRATGISWL